LLSLFEFLFSSSYGLVLLSSVTSLTIFAIAVPFLQKRTVKGLFKRLNGAKGGKLAVDGKVDRAILTRAVNDLLSPENPAGAILMFFPSVSAYLKTNPQSVVGFVRLLDNIGNLAQFKETMTKLNSKPENLNNINDYNKYR
jgi:hypothetical protein